MFSNIWLCFELSYFFHTQEHSHNRVGNEHLVILFNFLWPFSEVNRWKNRASRRKSIKLCMEIVHDIRRPYSSWVFYRPEWVSLGKNFFSSKLRILYTVRKLIKNWANINKRVWSEDGLVQLVTIVWRFYKSCCI